MSSDDADLRMVVGHHHEPDPATFRRSKDGAEADILNPWDYPILAVCVICREKIITEALFIRNDWRTTVLDR